MLDTLGWMLVLSLVINALMFLIAFRLRSDKLTDVSYALTFIILASFDIARATCNYYSLIGISLIYLWSLRIGGFLLYRVIRAGRDRRFDDIREHFWQFAKFWLGQAVTVWILMVPAGLGLATHNTWHTTAIIGIIVWLTGFVLEAVADLQKYRFTHTPANKDHWIDSGVWHYSRHPNYLGEILVWVGIYAYLVPALSPVNRLISVISPLFITVLLLFVSGIPILEKSADRRWGSEPAYRDYKRTTSLLVPLPKKRVRP
jgi:steroid 5-alpha reductase family enzyme